MKRPIVTGQCAQVLELIREHQPLLSFVLTADHAIPEAAARVHDLRSQGWNVTTHIVPEVRFRGRTRRNAALYSLGVPEWPRPGFLVADDEAGFIRADLAGWLVLAVVAALLLIGGTQ